MKIKRRVSNVWIIFLIIMLVTVAACSSRGGNDFAAESVMEVEVTRVVTEVVEVAGESVMEEEVAEEEMMADEDSFEPAPDAPAGQSGGDGNAQSEQPAQQQRLIIKDGNMTVTVDDTETAVNQASDVAVSLGGYIINQTVFDDPNGYRFATMRLGVPVDQFETALRALRDLGEVTNESASGEDVTDQFVDLNSRLDNLTATRDRLRAFLDEAINVDEALRVNNELRQIEEEIAVIQGRINFLADRAAFSTIDLTLNPIVPTPTPSPTPTATPIPTAQSWRPGDTARVAGVELQETAQDAADFVIFNSIATLPWLLVFALVGYIGWRIYNAIFRREAVAQQDLNTVEEDEDEA